MTLSGKHGKLLTSRKLHFDSRMEAALDVSTYCFPLLGFASFTQTFSVFIDFHALQGKVLPLDVTTPGKVWPYDSCLFCHLLHYIFPIFSISFPNFFFTLHKVNVAAICHFLKTSKGRRLSFSLLFNFCFIAHLSRSSKENQQYTCF